MARIAIFCDGTWNSPSQSIPTHVHRLAQAAKDAASEQKTIYVEGVGSGVKQSTFFGKIFDRIGGGVFGWGLDDNIKQAYLELVEAYKIGDEIQIFGFSRGAYTARSLAGMLRKCGILTNPTPARVNDAFDLYRLAGPEHHPDALKVLNARRALSPHVATSMSDVNWRVVNPPQDRTEDSHFLKIRYLGIWDTVGALGVPISLLGPVASLWNRRYSFHDTSLSSMVEGARHAIGLDERRVFYRPSLWGNLEQSQEGEGLNRGDRGPLRPYQQVWFIGTHAIVGGSGASRGLATLTLDWVAQGATDAGLTIKAAPPLLDQMPDALEASTELDNTKWIYRVVATLLAWRKGPEHPVDLHVSAGERIAQKPRYRPKSLKALMPDLFGAETNEPPPTARRGLGGGER